jgi:hypothetical protein
MRQRVFDDVPLATEVLVLLGLEGLPALAATCRAICMATRSPDWRRLSEARASSSTWVEKTRTPTRKKDDVFHASVISACPSLFVAIHKRANKVM